MQIELFDKTLLFKNFRGEKGRYNLRGERTFSVLLEEEEEANALREQGWNIKPLRSPDEPGEIWAWHLPVKINFEGSRRQPRVIWVTLDPPKKLVLNEQTLNLLDYQEIVQADLRLNSYEWSVDGKTGVKAYLDTLYAVVAHSALDARYEDVGPAFPEVEE